MSAFPSWLFKGSRFAVVGLGRNGLPVAHALSRMGAEVVGWDDSPTVRAAANDVMLEDPTAGDFRFDALLLSPGIPHRLPRPHAAAERARRMGVPILSDAELLYQAVRRAGSRARFVGITGTNGKSTTTALLAHILSGAGVPVAAGGNLGMPALALPMLAAEGVYVLEMSSYMLERLATLRFDAAAMLNLSPDHLDRHGDMTGYVAAKRAVFDRQGTGDLAVIGVDDALSRATAMWLRGRAARVVGVSGTTAGRAVRDIRASGRPSVASRLPEEAAFSCAGDIQFCPAEGPALPGPHGAQNAAAASVIAQFLGVTRAAIVEGIATFPGLPHRQQLLRVIDGVAFINDSKATNADAAAQALACYDRVVWIAGGQAKEGGIEPLAPFFPRIVHAFLIGRDAPVLAGTLAAYAVPHEIAGTLTDATGAAYAVARAEGAAVVLLSPACASFDQFSGFEARGERFAALVASLAPERVA